jgi:HD superfamily phosphohydrolase
MIPKRRFIKDPVWGNIEVTEWECALFDHFLVNRLHHIVQNSSAYKIYPGLKYSRFSHTLGVVHVATQIFINVILNSEPDALEMLRQEAEKFEQHCRPETLQKLRETIPRLFRCPPEFASVLAVVRVGAILHDIGHLPYSHVFEHALQAFLDGHYEGSVTVAAPAKKSRDQLRRGIETMRAKARVPGEPLKLHELLGERFARILANWFHDDLMHQVVAGAVRLLHEPEMPLAKSVLVSTMDADRIDFVRRDSMFSGLQSSSVDFGRLFACYELSKYDPSINGSVRWGVRPNRRGASEGEKLLGERFQDYKYIISHHKVHFFDELLDRLILRLLARGGVFDDFLSNLDRLLVMDEPENVSERTEADQLLRALLLEFDDPWLDVTLRRAAAGLDRQASEDQQVDHKFFVAYSEKRNSFESLFKRDEDFRQRCEQVVPALLEIDAAAYAVARVNKFKYRLEADVLRELQVVILIGETATKASHGIKDDETAQFFGLADLKTFLVGKMRQAPWFNIWIAVKGNAQAAEKSNMQNAVLQLVGQRLKQYLETDEATQRTLHQSNK